MYITTQNNMWWAYHDVPPSLREKMGKKRFRASLKTHDRGLAKVRAAILEARWLAEIEVARHGPSGIAPGDGWMYAAQTARLAEPLEQSAERMRQALRQARTPDERDQITDLMIEEAHERAGEVWGDPDVDPNDPTLNQFVGLATGKLVPLERHLEEYLKTLTGQNRPKSIDMKRNSIKELCKEFKTVSDVKRRAVQAHVNKLAEKPLAPASIRRILSELRGYWGYLKSIQIVEDDNDPFVKLTLPSVPRGGRAGGRKPFTPAQVLELLAEARKRECSAAIWMRGARQSG
jgi:hypothetical protein